MSQKLMISNVIKQTIEPEFMRKVLEIYDDKYQFLSSASITGNEITATIKVDTYPYTSRKIFNYVTAPSLSLATGQVCYVFVGEIIRSNLLDQFREFSLQKYFELRDRGDLVFKSIQYKFKKKIPKNKEFTMCMQLHSVKRMRSLVVTQFEFQVPGYLAGKTSLIAKFE